MIRKLLLIYHLSYNTKTIWVAYKSEYNHKRKNQVILLMIIDGNKWDYLVVSNLSCLKENYQITQEVFIV